MVHRCNVECYRHDQATQEIMGSENGAASVWLPFTFLLDTVTAIKEASDDPEDANYRCTTLYMDDTRSFIIDTPFVRFEKIWIDFMTGESVDESNNNETEL